MDNDKKIESLSVVIPAFNEESIIEKSIVLLHDKLNGLALDYEIIVIDDCSSDNTANILKNLALRINNLKVLHNSRHQGLGGTLKTGFSLASKELVFYTDADMPIDYQDIYNAVKFLRETNADVITAFKKNRYEESIYRNINSFVYNWLVSLLFRTKIHDINFSLKLIKRNVLEMLNLKSRGSFIDAEIIIKSVYLGYKIKQFGVIYTPRKTGHSTLGRPMVALEILYEIIKYYREIRNLKKKK